MHMKSGNVNYKDIEDWVRGGWDFPLPPLPITMIASVVVRAQACHDYDHAKSQSAVELTAVAQHN